jgi:hypothetical protein
MVSASYVPLPNSDPDLPVDLTMDVLPRADYSTSSPIEDDGDQKSSTSRLSADGKLSRLTRFRSR